VFGTGGAGGADSPAMEPAGPAPLEPTGADAPGEQPSELPLGTPQTPPVASSPSEPAGTAADAGVLAPDDDSTHGSGGVVGPADLTSSRGLSYKIDAPAGDSPHGLLVLLHGSTASNYENFIGLMRDVAAEYDLIPVSVLAPNGQGWNEGDQVRAAELLHQLVQEDLLPRYDIEKRRVLFSGQSSGGGFLASNFIPAHAQDYQGGAFLQCGAAPPNIAFMPTAETRQQFRMHFEITTEDPIWPEYYAAAIAAYGSAQMQFTMDNTKPGGHCAFDQQQVILDHIDFVLGSAAAAP
jgi:predicted esterase